jgi:hypothetical protein
MKLTNFSRYFKPAAAVALLSAVGAFPAFADGFSNTGTTTVSVSVDAEASLEVTTGSTQLMTSGNVFNVYTGLTNFTYKIRTATNTGKITVTLGQFSPTGGPTIGGAAGDALTYSCTVSASATPCSANTTASTSATTVATFAADAHSKPAGDAGQVNWTLPNDPAYPVGTYTSTATFTISAF